MEVPRRALSASIRPVRGDRLVVDQHSIVVDPRSTAKTEAPRASDFLGPGGFNGAFVEDGWRSPSSFSFLPNGKPGDHSYRDEPCPHDSQKFEHGANLYKTVLLPKR